MQVWEQLLAHLSAYHPNLGPMMADEILATVLDSAPTQVHPGQSPDERKEEQKERATARWTLAVWLLWLWRGNSGGLDLDRETKRDIWSRLAPALFHGDAV